jgi:hypothetical protein
MSEIDDRPQTISTPPERGAGNLGMQRLKPNAVGLVGVLFMSVAAAAPDHSDVGQRAHRSGIRQRLRCAGRLPGRHDRAGNSSPSAFYRETD